ncbi:MAG: hypothetical protein JXM70_15100 [Pirellulales bacterium]|nr:hypothetical protein [Pirellulales bacterium]
MQHTRNTSDRIIATLIPGESAAEVGHVQGQLILLREADQSDHPSLAGDAFVEQDYLADQPAVEDFNLLEFEYQSLSGPFIYFLTD